MSKKDQILYLVKLIIPFLVLGYFRSIYFYLPIILIIFFIPFDKSRLFLINMWVSLGIILQKIISPLFFAFIYFLVLTPLALLRKCFDKNTALNFICPRDSNLTSLDDSNNPAHYKELW